MRYEKRYMMMRCREFMEGLRELLKDTYEFGESPFAATSCYLVPNGTADQNTYYSKPQNSFRCSDHWSWYANLKKCSEPRYVQCYNADALWPNRREGSGATKPIYVVLDILLVRRFTVYSVKSLTEKPKPIPGLKRHLRK